MLAIDDGTTLTEYTYPVLYERWISTAVYLENTGSRIRKTHHAFTRQRVLFSEFRHPSNPAQAIATGILPITGVPATDTLYWVINPTEDNFQIALERGGTPITIQDSTGAMRTGKLHLQQLDEGDLDRWEAALLTLASAESTWLPLTGVTVTPALAAKAAPAIPPKPPTGRRSSLPWITSTRTPAGMRSRVNMSSATTNPPPNTSVCAPRKPPGKPPAKPGAMPSPPPWPPHLR